MNMSLARMSPKRRERRPSLREQPFWFRDECSCCCVLVRVSVLVCLCVIVLVLCVLCVSVLVRQCVSVFVC